MIHLLLADDDPLFRARFRGMADWERAGFHVMADARNGREAIAAIERRVPDIILTDISMPILDGIGLLEYVRMYHPAIPVIALSAFDDFPYVRACLKNGAQDYLLKHKLTTEQLFSVINAALANQKPIAPEPTAGRREREEFFFLLLAGWFPSAQAVTARGEALGIQLPERGCIPIVARLDDADGSPLPEKDPGEISDGMLGMIRELLTRSMMDIIAIGLGRLLLLYPFSDSRWFAASYREDLELAAENIRRFFGKSISFGVGDVCRSLPDLPIEYKKACLRYDNDRFLGKHGFIAQGGMVPEPQALTTLSADEARNIVSLLHAKEAADLRQALHGLFLRLEREGRSASELTFIYAELIHILLRFSQSYGFHPPSGELLPLDAFQSIHDLREWFCAKFLAIHSAAHACKGHSYGDYTRAAMQYMRAHYRERISLGCIAAELNLNASYLSRLFKEETGENLIRWLNDLRIDEAERLLKERHLTIREIADLVGIGNYNHFFTMFRQSKGITPSEYRRRLADSEVSL